MLEPSVYTYILCYADRRTPFRPPIDPPPTNERARRGGVDDARPHPSVNNTATTPRTTRRRSLESADTHTRGRA